MNNAFGNACGDTDDDQYAGYGGGDGIGYGSGTCWGDGAGFDVGASGEQTLQCNFGRETAGNSLCNSIHCDGHGYGYGNGHGDSTGSGWIDNWREEEYEEEEYEIDG